MPDLYVAQPDKDLSIPQPGKVVIKKREMHPFASFHIAPEGITFENQEKDEEILLFLRRHFITNINWIAGTIAFTLLPIVVFLFHTLQLVILPELPPQFLLVILLFYYLIVFGYFYMNFLSWFYNIALITTLRVVDIDVENLQSKNVAATDIEGIVDVEYMQRGFFQNFFDYGNVLIQTEGIKSNFEFLRIPHPAKVTDVISDLISGREIG
ncbi:MAG: hypothetical protein HZC02_05140 [Candidatus Levybacteria bacterium]|nr:hypothetical protein [Candidatus Levybacteria bacterium]